MSRTARLLVLVSFGLVMLAARTVLPVPQAAVGAFGHGPTVVLVHGLGSRAAHWLPVARRLARDHRVVLVDLPGHGLSAMPDPLTVESAAAELDRAIAAEPGPVTLVGHSLGGLVAAEEACEHPERVRALVLVETTLRPPVDDTTRTHMLARLDSDYEGLLRDAYLDFGRDPRQGVALWQQARAVDRDVMKAWIRLALTADLSARAAALRCPVTAVLAERSWAVGEPWAAAAQALGLAGVPQLEPVRITGCGHFVMLDRPDELVTVIAHAARATAPAPIATVARAGTALALR